MTVKLTIKNCRECPKLKLAPYYTADSFERPEEWLCTAKNNKRITIYDWPEKAPPIPVWCPLRPKKRESA